MARKYKVKSLGDCAVCSIKNLRAIMLDLESMGLMVSANRVARVIGRLERSLHVHRGLIGKHHKKDCLCLSGLFATDEQKSRYDEGN